MSESQSALRTFLIADIRGYTRFTEEYGDEAAADLAASFAELVADGVHAHEGELVELRGDEALAATGACGRRGPGCDRAAATVERLQARDGAGADRAPDRGVPAFRGMPDRWEISSYRNSKALAAAYEGERRNRPDTQRDTGKCNAFSWGGEREWLHGPDKPGGRVFCYFDGNVT